MNARVLLAGILLMTTATLTAADDDGPLRQLVADDARVEKLVTGMKFTEGPVWITRGGGGFLIFSDIPANRLNEWNNAAGMTAFRKDSRNANGNTIDREGRLISCEHATRRVVRLEHEQGTITVLADKFEGKRFNSPNDVVVKSDGSVWFTDPTYGTPQGEPKEIDGRYVYRVDPETKQVTKVADGFDQPNGLCFSPDEKRLYVADSDKPRHIRVFDVQVDSTLSNGRVFCTIDKGIPDGIRCDEKGNVWSSAGDGVQVFAPDGKLIGRIPVPESPTNLCFGGAEGKTLFITAWTSLYAIPTNVRGAKRPTP
jgi:gluconolactonase